MKFRHVIPAIMAVPFGSSLAQEQAYIDDPNPLVVGSAFSAQEHYEESYINRNNSVTVQNNSYYTGDHVNIADGVIVNDGSSFIGSHINIGSTNSAAIAISGGGNIELRDSSISSGYGNILLNSTGSGSIIFDLNNVNLDDAKNQTISITGSGNSIINLSNGTNFDGVIDNIAFNTSLNISTGASWNVTESAYGMSTMQTLSIDSASMISFQDSGFGSFNIVMASNITLEAGATIMLGMDGANLLELISLNGGRFYAQLFNASNAYSSDGVRLITSDHQIIEYTTTDDFGNYLITGIIPSPSIPEPTAAALGFTALGLLSLRRRK